jgi:hypothetical protein
VIIIGGINNQGKETLLVEEIDFIKRNNVFLTSLHHARAKPNTFLVNDAIFVFGGISNPSDQQKDGVGEKFLLSENKWRPFDAKSLIGKLGGAIRPQSSEEYLCGPAALLYE